MGEARVNSGVEILTSYGVPNYPFPERAGLAFRSMSDYKEIRSRPPIKYVKFEVDREAVSDLLQRVLSEDRVSIGDSEARSILTSYGLRIPYSEVVETADQAVEIAGQIGYPVVLKIASPDILHKTDVGGVKVGLSNAEAVRDAFELMVYRAQRYIPEARIWGCLVQEISRYTGERYHPYFQPKGRWKRY